MTHAAPRELGSRGGGEAHGSSPGDVDRLSGLDAGHDSAVKPGREDVAEEGQVPNLRHGVVLVGKLQQVEVRVRDHHVLCLAADSPSHVWKERRESEGPKEEKVSAPADPRQGRAAGERWCERACVRCPSPPLTHVSVGRSRPGGVDVEANTGMAGLAHGATAASNVEGHRAKVALFDELDVVAALDDLSSDLVAENHVAARKGRSAADHVLVAAADVRAHHLEDDTVVALSLLALGHDRARRAVELQLWEGDVLRAVRATSGQARLCVVWLDRQLKGRQLFLVP